MADSTIPLMSSELLATKIKAYNPYNTPPDIELAKLHALARRVSMPQNPNPTVPNQSDLVIKNCPCCGLPIENKQFPLCVPLQKISFLGVCFPLYFSYIKFCFILLFVCFIIAGIANLVMNLNGSNCEAISDDSFMCTVSFMNILDAQYTNRNNNDDQSAITNSNLDWQSFLNCFAILLSLVAFEFFRDYQRKFAYKNRQKYSITQYALLLSFVPEGYDKEDIEKFINDTLEKLNCQPTKILKMYYLNQLSEYVELYSKKRELVTRKNNEKIPQRSESATQEIEKINIKLRALENDLTRRGGSTSQNRIIVVLESRKAARTLQSHFEKQFLSKIATYIYIYFGKKIVNQEYYIKVSKAPEPSDILWGNLSYQSHVKNTVRVLTTVIAALLIGVGFFILLLLKKHLKAVQTSESTDPDVGEYISIGVSFLGSTLVALTNTLLGIFIRKFVGYERHKTQTSYFVTVGRRLTAVLVFNMTLTTLLANLVWPRKMNNLSGFLKLSVAGLCSDVFFLFITNSYMSSIFNYFDIMWGVKMLKRRNAINSGKNCKLTQLEANSLFEGHPVDMALRFANVNKTLIFTGLFIPFIPLGLVFSLVGFVIVYWVDKLLLLRRYVCANKLSYRLPKTMLNTAEWFIVAYAFGNLLMFFIPLNGGMEPNSPLRYRSRKSNKFFWFSVFIFVLALLYKFVIPTNSIHNFFIKFKARKHEETYGAVHKKLPETYDRFHPVEKRKNMQVSELMGIEITQEEINFNRTDYRRSNVDTVTRVSYISANRDQLHRETMMSVVNDLSDCY